MEIRLTNQHCHSQSLATSVAKTPVFNQCPPSFAAKENKVCENGRHPISSLSLLCIRTFTFVMSKHPDQSHDLRVFTLYCGPQGALCSQRENPLRGNTKTGKTVCVTHQTALTLCAYNWCYGWAQVQGSTAQPILPLLVCLGWYAIINQRCPCSWPLLHRFLLKDHTLCCILVLVEISGISFVNWAEPGGN